MRQFSLHSRPGARRLVLCGFLIAFSGHSAAGGAVVPRRLAGGVGPDDHRSNVAMRALEGPANGFGYAPQAEAPAALPEAEILENFSHIVGLIWTDEEREAWQQLSSDEARRGFVDAFWERRDPTLGTEANEFREVYMGRVSSAAASFTGEGVAGYRTDRGRVFIIYGGNALLSREARQVTASTSVGAGGETVGGEVQTPAQQIVYLWTMDTSINPFLQDKPRLRFEPLQGAYALTTRDLDLGQDAFLANRDVRQLFAARRAEPASPFVDGGEADASPKAGALRDLVEEGLARDALALRHEVSFFPAGDGNTYTVIAFEVGKAGLSFPAGDNVEVFGFVLRDAPNADPLAVHRIDDALAIAVDEGRDGNSETYTLGVTLSPGAHRLAFGVIDIASGRTGTQMVPIDVPDFAADTLVLTSVARAKAPMRRTEEPIDVDRIYDSMRIGPLVLDVDVDHVFNRDDTVSLLYFLMGAVADPDSGAVSLEVTHRILLAADNQSIARIPARTLSSPAVTQDIPLAAVSSLQEGTDYMIQIHVRDLLSGAEIYHAVPFSVAAAGS